MHPIRSIALSWLLLGGFSSLSWAQSQRYPTMAELAVLRQTMQQHIAQIEQESLYPDRRTLEQRQQLASFIQAWSMVDPQVVPFLGHWLAVEESLSIYPSRTIGQVCLIHNYLGDVEFSLGHVADGVVQTEENQLLIRQGNYLGSAFVVEDQPDIYEYTHPQPLQPPTSIPDLQNRQVIEQFQQAGCRVDQPQ